jgi:hypothetical protein
MSSSLNLAVQRERELQAKLRSCDLERWVAPLAEHTFKSVFVELSVADARELIAEFKRRKTGLRSDMQALASLHAQIETAIASLGTAACFAKLSSRSPKDSTAAMDRALTLVQTRLTERRDAGLSVTANDVAAAIAAATTVSLKCSSAHDVIELMVTSERVCDDDLPLALEFAGNWSQHIVVREFNSFRVEQEFRAFVFGGRVTAVTQYFCGAFYPALVAQRDAIGALVREFFDNTVRARTAEEQCDEFSLDLVVSVDAKAVTIVELNPFGADGCGTGTALFDWRNAHDTAVLLGVAPFECRVVESAPYGSIAALKLRGPLSEWMARNAFVDD